MQILSPRTVFAALVLTLFAAMPWLANTFDQSHYQDVFARIMIWSIAAVSLNLMLGFGGMVSFGHALYLGVAGYAVGIAAHHEITNAWLQWSIGLLSCALISAIFGAISLRTRGVYFIMITMALSQMVYFLIISAEEYGSDDGLVIYARSDFGLAWLDLNDAMIRYYLIFVLLIGCLYFSYRLVNSRFGMVVRGARSNQDRVEAMGYSTYWYRLTCFVIAGVMCGIAGLLSANVEEFISPDTLHWTRSGELIFMVVLGGMGSVFGPVTGALVFHLLSKELAEITTHWHLVFGPFLVLIVLFAPRGIDSLFGLSRGIGGRADK